MSRTVRALGAASLLLALTGCEYVRLLRPSVIRQLNPRVVRLVNELPATDDGIMRAAVRVSGNEDRREHPGLLGAPLAVYGVTHVTGSDDRV